MKLNYIAFMIIGEIFLTGCLSQHGKERISPSEYYDDKINLEEEIGLDYREEIFEKELTSTNLEKKTLEELPSFQKDKLKKNAFLEYKSKDEMIVFEGTKVKVNVESIPLHEFVDFIFSNVLKVNYTVDKKVKKLKQPITLNMATIESKDALLKVVKQILLAEQVNVKLENGVFFVRSGGNKKAVTQIENKQVIFGTALPSSLKHDEEVIIFVPFSYIEPHVAMNFINTLGLKIHRYPLSKGINVLKGKVQSIGQALEMIKLIDQPSLLKKRPYLLHLHNISVEKFHEKLKAIFKLNSIPIAMNSRELGVAFESIEELNALLILSPKPEWLEMVLFWQKKLDVPSETIDEAKLYIYKVKHRKADELGLIIQNILSTRKSSNGSDINQTNRNSLAGKKTLDNKVNISTFQAENISLQSDLYTNSLMMFITPKQYKEILPIIERLDKLPLQVLIELTLAEVDITKNYNLGFEWSILNNKARATTSSTSTFGAHTLTLGKGGLSSLLFNKNISSIINAYAEDKVLDILSRPRLMILNNMTGMINVGQQIPTLSSEVSASDISSGGKTPSILRNVSYINTGITLNLTPTINSNGTLTLDVSITLSEAATNKTSSIDSPLIINRELKTNIVMKSDSSVLIGGLISKNISKGDSGVPFLKDLPLIGNVFRGESNAYIKKELIILIHPKIISNNSELEKETRKFKFLLKSIKNII